MTTRKVDVFERKSKLSSAKQALLKKRLQAALSSPSESITIPRRSSQAGSPLSFVQERFWFLDQFEPGNPAYNRPMGIRFTGPLNVAVLEQSLSEILRRHEILRTIYPTVEGQPTQLI